MRLLLKHRLYRVIFDNDSPAGKLFDIVLNAAVLVGVAVEMY